MPGTAPVLGERIRIILVETLRDFCVTQPCSAVLSRDICNGRHAVSY